MRLILISGFVIAGLAVSQVHAADDQALQEAPGRRVVTLTPDPGAFKRTVGCH